NGTATIPFTAYDSKGVSVVSGTVNVLVASQTTTPPASTTPSTPSTTKTFSDVPAGAWYYNDVTTLAAAGIIGGYSDGTFRPEKAVNYGEALKLILLAAGYPEQAQAAGANWAANYLNLAISNGILSGSASDYSLTKEISRNDMAAMAAKAMKLTPVTSGTSPYADTNDGYVRALTDAGIVSGDTTSGQRIWNGTRSLNRAEISKIVLAMRQRTSSGTTRPAPTVDTNAPGWITNPSK
ncbi:MAG: S-layer homology domain-containing protein, partial [Oscillospiraceae bacterium]|nr:S-layer homology domain-containing protein [Oscillospiraceae bacterium]